jgi:flagellar protein FliS
MDSTARDSYLEAQVMTATPQKLRLMLIEGAIRFARETMQHWEQEQHEAALESIDRCRSLLAELIAGVQSDGGELSKKVAGLYLFLFRSISEAQSAKDGSRLQDIIEILEIERETWVQVCTQLPHSPLPAPSAQERAREVTADSSPVVPATDSPNPAGGLVLDA